MRRWSLSLLVRAVAAKVAWLLASETQPFLHQLSLFFIGHFVIGSSDHVNIHGVQVFFSSPERPTGLDFFFFFLWFSPIEELHEPVVVGVQLEGPLIPFG